MSKKKITYTDQTKSKRGSGSLKVNRILSYILLHEVQKKPPEHLPTFQQVQEVGEQFHCAYFDAITN